MGMSISPHETSISSSLGADHDRLDLLLADTYERVASDPDFARQSFAAFVSGLKRHIDIEDNVLFVAFEERTGIRGMGPTAVMRREHREIEARLGRIADALVRPSVEQVRTEIDNLRALLADHNMREERVLYPACDQMLDADTVRSVDAQLRRR
jgi:hemerythrin-like domain-containing protein